MQHHKLRATVVILLLVVAAGVGVLTGYVRSVFADSAQAVRGVSGDRWADVVLGQPNFQEGMINERTAYKANLPGGIHVDRSQSPNRVYVYDSGNSRILGYASLGTCATSGSACTTDSDCAPSQKCQLIANKPASVVLGQTNFQSGSCNRDANYSDFPLLATPSASTLCTLEPDEISPLEAGSYSSMDTDTEGNLYVADWQNNRVLRFDDPMASGIGLSGADRVFGQTNYTSALCNQGANSPTASTLCLSRLDGSPTNPGYSLSYAGGVSLDKWGNLWVVDVHNHRVLRYPKVNNQHSATADRVLGQPNFTSSSWGTGLNQLRLPEAVEIDADGNVYVVDGNDNHRILKYAFPQTNGMSGVTWGYGFQQPTAIELDPSGQALWVSDNARHTVSQFNLAGNTVQKVLFKDTYDGQWPPSASCNSVLGFCSMQDARGSIGITSDGDVWLTASQAYQNAVRFRHPIPSPTAGVLVAPDYALFGTTNGEHNLLSSRSFASPAGVVFANGQMIMTDRDRMLYWSTASAFTTWRPADGQTLGAGAGNTFSRITADEQGYLYAIHGESIEIYQLPISMGEQPVSVLPWTLPDLEGHTVNLHGYQPYGIGDLEVNAAGTELWFSHTFANRVLRIRNPRTSPVVDVVLGQLDNNDVLCNFGGNTQIQNYDLRRLCAPGGLAMDSLGNLYVADANLEDRGNKRMIVWSALTLPSNTSTTIYAPVAHRYGLNGVGPLEMAFDSQDRAVMSFNDYQDSVAVNPRHSIVAFDDLYDSDAHTEFMEYLVMPFAMTFDSQDNLYVVDLNRFRLLKYLQPLGGGQGEE